MRFPRLAARRSLVPLALGLSLAAWAASPESHPVQGSASAELDGEGMELGLRIRPGPASAFGLRLEAEAEAAEARLFLALGDDGGPFLAFGPATPAGALRFIIDPASSTALAAGLPVDIDASMRAGRAALIVGTGPVRAFAVGESDGPLFSFRAAGLAGEPEEAPALPPRAAAAGIAVGGSGRGFAWSAVADASSRDGEEGGGGWSPDPRPDPGGMLAHAAFAASRRAGRGEARAAIAASAGRLEGTGLAAKVQARGSAGPISLDLSMGACGAAYRGLFGDAPADAFRGRAEARLALRRSASVSVSLEGFAERNGWLTAPSWGSSGSLSAAVPVDEGLSCSVRGTARADPRGGGSSAELSMALARRREDSRGNATRASLLASASWEDGAEGIAMEALELRADFSRDNVGRWPSAASRLELGLPTGPGSPVVARGWLEASLPLGPGFRRGTSRRISIRLDLPSAGVDLVPLAEGKAAPAFAASIAYRASF
jgi:hypothetical protein